jgi:hypothetical protein
VQAICEIVHTAKVVAAYEATQVVAEVVEEVAEVTEEQGE